MPGRGGHYRPRVDPIALAAFQRRLLAWFRRNGRDLPWRRTRDPYKILVSEVMLQQTQVDRVRGYYRSFLQDYPTVRDLAEAHPARVRESWEGLGYYARARNLHAAAR
ncbi:MAG: A/G-specific adenine glycosylase, partial [Zetaproteobacteria bacterium]